MSPYLIVLVLLIAGSILSRESRFEKAAYFICFSVLFCMLFFRYGQGTDWFNYSYIYSIAPETLNFQSSFYSSSLHTEVGWKLINNLFKVFGLSFSEMVMFVSFVEMVLMNKAISRLAANKALALLLTYPTVYLTYYFSALRQGLVIACFLGVMIEWLNRREYGKYIAWTLILASIHSMALVLLVPLITRRMSFKSVGVFLIACALLGASAIAWLSYALNILKISYSSSGFSPVALIYRCAIALIVYFLYKSNIDLFDKKTAVKIEELMIVYYVGLGLYLVLMSNSLLASRVSVIFSSLEIILIPMLIVGAGRKQQTLLLFTLFVLICVMTVKNIDMYVIQGSYASFVSMWNYPYISIFDQDQLMFYRSSRLSSLL